MYRPAFAWKPLPRLADESRREVGIPSVPAQLVVACVVAALALPALLLLLAPRSALTSDESLYLSEALNIASGEGPRYANLDWVHHRGFLFPALLAIPLKVTGDFTTAYWVTKTFTLLNAGIAATLALRMFGRGSAAFVLLLVLPNWFLNRLGTTLFLDGVETSFLLASMLALWEGHARGRPLYVYLGGVALGLAFLTKEAALLWLPLAAAFSALTYRSPVELARNTLPYYAGFVIVAGWWWIYVWVVDSRIYLWPYSPRALVLPLCALAAMVIVGGFAWERTHRLRPASARVLLRTGTVLAVLAWIAAFMYVMEATSWPYPRNYIQTVPHYLSSIVARNVSPWPLVGAGVVVMLARARSDAAFRLLGLGFALWLPFFTFAAHRGFSLRDMLPMIYVSYIAAGYCAARLSRWFASQRSIAGALSAAVLIVALCATGGWSLGKLHADQPGAVGKAGDWHNPLVVDTAAWIESNVSPGTTIVASRLYFSHLYLLTDGRYPVTQLPVVNVAPDAGSEPYLRARSTLFRWEDSRLAPAPPDVRWITVSEFAEKKYFTALAQADLIEEIKRRNAAYVVISGEDAGFSSTAYLDYFIANPAFTLVHSDSRAPYGAFFIFRVDASRLDVRPYSTVLSATVLNRLWSEHRGSMTAAEFLSAIGPDGVTVRPASGLVQELVPHVRTEP